MALSKYFKQFLDDNGITADEKFMICDKSGEHQYNSCLFSINGQNGGKLIADEKIEPAVIKDLTLALLRGALIVKKLPWQPKYGDKYYYPGAGFRNICSAGWGNSVLGLAYKEAGFIFKTYEECEAALPELRKKYLGGESNE